MLIFGKVPNGSVEERIYAEEINQMEENYERYINEAIT
jgi:hypothetical protein